MATVSWPWHRTVVLVAFLASVACLSAGDTSSGEPPPPQSTPRKKVLAEQADIDRGSLSAAQQQRWRARIRTALFLPDPLPPLAAQSHSRFQPEPGIVAERVTYASQFGLRVPAILYLPEQRQGKVPGLIVVNGHGGDKYSWYAFYTGVLYARAGAAVLTYDPIGEGERHRERRSGTRAHDQNLASREMGQRLGGLLVTDVMQAVAYLQSRPEVDPRRIGAMGYSLGSFLVAVTGAVDPRLHACVLTGGGNLDGPDGYWDRSKPMCQGIPYQALQFLGDRPAALYALHASRGPTLIVNGLADSVVGIPQHRHGEAFFKDLQDRTARLKGSREGIFEFQLIPDISHRPFFVTRPVALWLEQHLDFPYWTDAAVRSLPETHITRWATAYGVAMDRSYASEEREGGTRALGKGIPALSRATLSVFSPDEWEREKGQLVYENWVEAARAKLKAGP
ncbi:MAG: prolyl oligopeptidase family serine peptidase [Gemmataceae bacterium]|nr:prolyl oligopeptidase family serine peptidase [Gemmataceae bacterium]